MARNRRPILLVALLLAAPATAVRAQNSDSAGYDGGSGSVAHGASGATQADSRSNLPGWTGRTFVPGSHSTIGGDAVATRRQQTGQYGPSR